MYYYDSEAETPVFTLPENETLFEEDTKKGIDCLEKQLGTEVKWFAYRYGFGTSRTDEILISHGIPNIFTLRAKVNRLGNSRYFVGRVMVRPESRVRSR